MRRVAHRGKKFRKNSGISRERSGVAGECHSRPLTRSKKREILKKSRHKVARSVSRCHNTPRSLQSVLHFPVDCYKTDFFDFADFEFDVRVKFSCSFSRSRDRPAPFSIFTPFPIKLPPQCVSIKRYNSIIASLVLLAILSFRNNAPRETQIRTHLC